MKEKTPDFFNTVVFYEESYLKRGGSSRQSRASSRITKN